MKITPTEKNLETLLHGLSTRYIVPQYQRDFSWTSDEIDQLWFDILAAYGQNIDDYFLGTLVLNTEGHGLQQADIVDGQQRLATFTILFSVLRDVANEFSENTEFLPEISRTQSSLKDAKRVFDLSRARLLEVSEPDNYFLELNKKDQPAFRSHIQDQTCPSFQDRDLATTRGESRIIKARKLLTKHVRDFIFSRVRDSQSPHRQDIFKDLATFLAFIMQRLKFISIEVATDYDAYLLFESLNFRGLELSTADLVKNKLLMKCDNEQQKISVLVKWDGIVSRLEEESRYPNLVDFLRFFWLAFRDSKPTKKQLYKAIRAEIDGGQFNVVEFISRLDDTLDSFVFVTRDKPTWPSSELTYGSTEQYLSEINTLRYSICIPALFAACFRYRGPSPLLLKEIVQRSLNFLFRLLTIGGLSAGFADEVFSKVVKAIRENKSREEILSHFVVDKGSNDNFKNDFAKFKTENNGVARYILAKIHVHSSGPEQIPKSDEVHVEHILPQDTKLWLGAGYAFPINSKPEDLIYSIGNMTLLNKRLNQVIANDVFDRKVVYYKCRETPDDEGTTFPMTYKLHEEYLAGKRVWDVVRIQERANRWSHEIHRIWPIE